MNVGLNAHVFTIMLRRVAFQVYRNDRLLCGPFEYFVLQRKIENIEIYHSYLDNGSLSWLMEIGVLAWHGVIGLNKANAEILD